MLDHCDPKENGEENKKEDGNISEKQLGPHVQELHVSRRVQESPRQNSVVSLKSSTVCLQKKLKLKIRT